MSRPDELRNLTHLFAVFTLASGLVWGGLVFTLVGSEPAELRPHTGGRTAPAERAGARVLTGTEHLSAARRLLDERPGAGEEFADSSETEKIAAARRHLEAIGPADGEYGEAQELLRGVGSLERRGSRPADDLPDIGRRRE
jgi:hypothetical protein